MNDRSSDRDELKQWPHTSEHSTNYFNWDSPMQRLCGWPRIEPLQQSKNDTVTKNWTVLTFFYAYLKHYRENIPSKLFLKSVCFQASALRFQYTYCARILMFFPLLWVCVNKLAQYVYCKRIFSRETRREMRQWTLAITKVSENIVQLAQNSRN
jgi:hypothetical protein